MVSNKRLYQLATSVLVLLFSALCVMIYFKRDVATTAIEQALSTVTLPTQEDISELDQSTQERLKPDTSVVPPTEEQIQKDRADFKTPEKNLLPTPEIIPPSIDTQTP